MITESARGGVACENRRIFRLLLCGKSVYFRRLGGDGGDGAITLNLSFVNKGEEKEIFGHL